MAQWMAKWWMSGFTMNGEKQLINKPSHMESSSAGHIIACYSALRYRIVRPNSRGSSDRVMTQ